jgi:hypothetical protein
VDADCEGLSMNCRRRRALGPSIEAVIPPAEATIDNKLNSRAHGVAKGAGKDGVTLKQI